MSNTVVTLTGDDANLFKAYQRIIAQQAKMDAGLKGIGDQSKKTKTGLDALAATDFDDLNDSMESLGDLSSLTEGITTSTFFKMATAVNVSQLAVDGLISSVQSSIEHFKELQRIGEKTLERTERTAAGQQEAAKNLVSMTPEEFKKVQEEVVPRIQKETSFVDRGLLSRAYGEVRSILPDGSQTEELLTTSAKLNLLTPDNLVETATAIADIVRTMKVTIPEAVGTLASAQTVARAPQQKAVARAIADVSAKAIGTSSSEVPITEIAKQAIGLYTAIGANDSEGTPSKTFTLNYLDQLRDPFTQKARDERDKRFDQLTRERDLEIENQRKLELDIARFDVNAKKFSPTDKTPKAEIARNSAAKARRDLERSQSDLKKTEEEMARISRLQAVQMNDPGTPLGRLYALSANPDTRTEFINNLTGEQAFRAPGEALMTPGSEARKLLEANLQAISTDPENANRLTTLLTATPQQKQALFSAKTEVERQVFDDAHPELPAIVDMRKIVDDVRGRGRDIPMNPMYKLLTAIGGNGGSLDDLFDANMVGTDAERTAKTTVLTLRDLQAEIADVTEPKSAEYSKFIDQQIESINQRLELYRDTVKNSKVMSTAKPILAPATETSVLTTPQPIVPLGSLPPTSTVTQAPETETSVVTTMPTMPRATIERPQARETMPADSKTITNDNGDSRTQIELLRKQNEQMDETNRLLKEMVRPTQPAPVPPPNPNAINAQQSLRNQE